LKEKEKEKRICLWALKGGGEVRLERISVTRGKKARKSPQETEVAYDDIVKRGD